MRRQFMKAVANIFLYDLCYAVTLVRYCCLLSFTYCSFLCSASSRSAQILYPQDCRITQLYRCSCCQQESHKLAIIKQVRCKQIGEYSPFSSPMQFYISQYQLADTHFMPLYFQKVWQMTLIAHSACKTPVDVDKEHII